MFVVRDLEIGPCYAKLNQTVNVHLGNSNVNIRVGRLVNKDRQAQLNRKCSLFYKKYKLAIAVHEYRRTQLMNLAKK